MLTERSEFLTPYTPYQPEVAQGGLQVMFEYQTAISELTALPVSNASVYEGASAVAAAAYMAKLHNGRSAIVVSEALHPHSIETLRTYARGYGMEVREVPTRDGVTDAAAWSAAIDADTSAAIFAQPNFLGAVEDAAALSEAARVGGRAGRARGRRPGGPDHARRARSPRRLRGRRGRRRGPAARQPARLRRPLVRVAGRPRGVPAPDARQDRRCDP